VTRNSAPSEASAHVSTRPAPLLRVDVCTYAAVRVQASWRDGRAQPLPACLHVARISPTHTTRGLRTSCVQPGSVGRTSPGRGIQRRSGFARRTGRVVASGGLGVTKSSGRRLHHRRRGRHPGKTQWRVPDRGSGALPAPPADPVVQSRGLLAGRVSPIPPGRGMRTGAQRLRRWCRDAYVAVDRCTWPAPFEEARPPLAEMRRAPYTHPTRRLPRTCVVSWVAGGLGEGCSARASTQSLLRAMTVLGAALMVGPRHVTALRSCRGELRVRVVCARRPSQGEVTWTGAVDQRLDLVPDSRTAEAPQS
jgi:hypothetical protein